MNKLEREALAALLKKGRLRSGLSGRQLAERAGVDNGTISLLEHARIMDPRIDTVRAIAEVLQLSLADVYATVNWLPDESIPSLRPYMRAKYGDLSDNDLRRIERLIARISRENNRGPLRGQDEQ